MSTSFIDSAITHISGSSSRHAGLASLVQQQDHDDPANRIALTAVALGYRRDEAKKSNNEYEGYKPEQLLSFVQQVMNRVVWQSRKMSILQTEEDEKDVVNGIDFSQDLADEYNIDRIETQHIKPTVDDDYATMTAVQSWLAARFNYLDSIDPLYYFHDLARDEATGDWYVRNTADNYDEAQMICDDIVAALPEQDAATDYARVANMSFK